MDNNMAPGVPIINELNWTQYMSKSIIMTAVFLYNKNVALSQCGQTNTMQIFRD